jgi:hypothetical protein
MSVSPSQGPAYQYPDSVPDPEFAGDDRFYAPTVKPGEEEAGPLRVSPEASEWIDRNVLDHGYVIDWGTREIIDPETGESKGTIPTSFPRVV